MNETTTIDGQLVVRLCKACKQEPALENRSKPRVKYPYCYECNLKAAHHKRLQEYYMANKDDNPSMAKKITLLGKELKKLNELPD